MGLVVTVLAKSVEATMASHNSQWWGHPYFMSTIAALVESSYYWSALWAINQYFIVGLFSTDMNYTESVNFCGKHYTLLIYSMLFFVILCAYYFMLYL